MMMWYNWFALSPSDELSQVPTPPSTCASPELPPHVKQQPVEKEETDKNVVAREASSVKNGMRLVCVCVCLCVLVCCVCVCMWCVCVCVCVCMYR